MKADYVSVSIVLIGKFQPSSFTLKELSRTKVLSEPDLEESQYETLIPNQAVITTLGTWGKLTVLEEQLTLESEEPPYIRIADLASRLVQEVAAGSQAWMLGINVRTFYPMDPKVRDRLGAKLVPAANWGAWGESISASMDKDIDDPTHGGLVVAHMRQGRPDERESGYLDVKVEPATKRQGTTRVLGVQFLANDHYQFPIDETLSSRTAATGKVVETIGSRFDQSIQRSVSIIEAIAHAGDQ